MKIIYKRNYYNYYKIYETYFLVGGQSIFRQVKYYKGKRLVKNQICQVIKDLSEIDDLKKTVHLENGRLWFDLIIRSSSSSFNLIDTTKGKETVSFRLTPELFTILEVLQNEY